MPKEPDSTDASIDLTSFAGSLMPGKGRPDNLFKFLGGLSQPEIADFLSRLFAVVGRVVDKELEPADLEAFLVEEETRARTLAVERGGGPAGLPSEPLPAPAWTQLERPLSQARIALFTSGAIRLPDGQPYINEGYTYEQALQNPGKAYDRNPAVRIIPSDADTADLLVEHIAYDVRAARRDINVIFPIDRLRELASQGIVGEVAAQHYAFSGLTNAERFSQSTAPDWARKIADEQIDAVLLSPG